eukprot:TRINITY_DN48106_c0_g1_i1.p1 TRINITY_DN48106_c0_g1~~TRINITY_DN48106_c0_g1_i1.p1  ORF type:complete len:323 (-),score=21.54 TRINITY_DN48106_c0_g1_i1:167-1135(-)
MNVYTGTYHKGRVKTHDCHANEDIYVKINALEFSGEATGGLELFLQQQRQHASSPMISTVPHGTLKAVNKATESSTKTTRVTIPMTYLVQEITANGYEHVLGIPHGGSRLEDGTIYKAAVAELISPHHLQMGAPLDLSCMFALLLFNDKQLTTSLRNCMEQQQYDVWIVFLLCLREAIKRLKSKQSSYAVSTSMKENNLADDECQTDCNIVTEEPSDLGTCLSTAEDNINHKPPKRKRRKKKAPTEEENTSFDPLLYKTQMCRNWKEFNKCPYGPRCLFAHGQREKRQYVTTNQQWNSALQPWHSHTATLWPDASPLYWQPY